jgi:hypothetical protein
MSRVFTSESTGAAIHVFSDDHCPPHVHARHRSEGWIARVGFSFLTGAVKLMNIAPSRAAPLRRTVNRLLSGVRAQLPACRRIWWETQETTCLTNQWAIVLTSDRIELSPERIAGAKRIADASYDPNLPQLSVTFEDGTNADVRATP